MRIAQYFILVIFASMQIVFAKAEYISYSDFVHMDYKQQVQTIEMIQDYLTEYENKQIVGSSQKSKRYQTYIKILNYFVNSAHAAPPRKDSQYLCYYGGWQSVINSRGKCMHPKHLGRAETQKNYIDKLEVDQATKDFLKNKIGNSYYKYSRKNVSSLVLDNSSDASALKLRATKSCTGPDEIICNPDVYGLHKGSKPFCVSGNKTYGINTSYLCAKANKEVKDKEGEEAHTQLMKGIIDGAMNGGSQNHLMSTMRMMYEMCLCSGDTTVLGKAESDDLQTHSLNYPYAQKMFYSRTCLGVLNQTQEIANAMKSDQKACHKLGGYNLTEKSVKKWDGFLHQSYKLVNEELQKLKSSASVDLMSGQITKAQLSKIHDTDKKQFEEIRNAHFKKYVEAGICPLDSPLGLKLAYNVETKILTATISGSTSRSVKWSAALPTPIEGAAIKQADENEKGVIKKFNITPIDKEYIVKVDATVDGQELTQEATIPKIDANADLILKKLDDEITDKDGSLLLSYVVTPEFSLGEMTAENLKIITPKDVAATKIEESLNHRIPMGHDDIKVEATYQFEGKELKSPPLQLKAPTASCQMAFTPAPDDKTKSEVKINFSSSLSKLSEDQLLKLVSDVKINVTTKDGNGSLTRKEEGSSVFIVDSKYIKDKKLIASLKADANFNINGKTKGFNCDLGPKLKPKKADPKECKVALEHEKQEDGSFKVKATVKYPGFKQGKDKKPPFKISWFNTAQKAVKAKTKKKKSETIGADTYEEVVEKDPEDINKNEAKLADYTKKYFKNRAQGSNLTATVSPAPGEEIKLLVVINDKDYSCYSEATLNVKGPEVKAPATGPGTPQFLNPNLMQQRQRSRTFYNGVR